jgi:predicted ATPase
MLLALTGPQGCGKTTVLTTLEEKGYNVVKRKTARSVLADWGMSLEEIYADRILHMKFQDALLERKLEDEKELRNSDEIWFTERSFVDTFVYSAQSLARYNDCSEWLDQYYHDCSEAQIYYDTVVYIAGGFDFGVEHDGVRGSNFHYAKMIELMMEHYYHKICSKYNNKLIIDTVCHDDRIKMITNHIEYCQTPTK